MVSNSLILESGKAKSLRLMLDCLTKFTVVFYFSQISYNIADISYIIACSTLLFPSDRSSQANFYAFCITHITCFSKKSVRIIAIFGLKSQNNRQIIPWKTWNIVILPLISQFLEKLNDWLDRWKTPRTVTVGKTLFSTFD